MADTDASMFALPGVHRDTPDLILMNAAEAELAEGDLTVSRP